MLTIVDSNHSKHSHIPDEQMQEHHRYLIQSYLDSHLIRNHSPRTIAREKSFLLKWFQISSNSFFTWNAMNLTHGRQRILDYSQNLIKAKIASTTIRGNLGILSRYFSFVLEHPFIKIDGKFKRIEHIYGPIDQPISAYDIPKHSYNGEQKGVPIDPENIYSFFDCLRTHYLKQNFSMSAITHSRNYTMAIIAIESGLRADEISHLEVSDLFFDSFKIQTRYAKGTRGSGKRARTTLFSPLARDSVRYYLIKYRDLITPVPNNYLFPNKQGRPIQYGSMNKALKEMITIARANNIQVLDHMGWHWFRRLFATRFIERFPHQLSALIELLGHTSPNTVHCYIKHSEAWMDRRIIQILEDPLWQ